MTVGNNNFNFELTSTVIMNSKEKLNKRGIDLFFKYSNYNRLVVGCKFLE